MKEKVITEQELESFRKWLILEEKSESTVEKYLRDVAGFASFADGQAVTKERVLSYKAALLEEGYAPRSVNSMLASLNSFFIFAGWGECRVRSIRMQKKAYCSEDKELTRSEYERLVFAARKKGNDRLELILQTICGTGIRVGELKYITVEAARQGAAIISLKGKTREILIEKKLKKLLLSYAERKEIKSGPLFITRSGKPVCRSNIWKEMKELCIEAKVEPGKVFPHNLRHLFARIFYSIQKDLAKLADLLGHSSIETTRLYIISTGAEHRRTLEKMRLIL